MLTNLYSPECHLAPIWDQDLAPFSELIEGVASAS